MGIQAAAGRMDTVSGASAHARVLDALADHESSYTGFRRWYAETVAPASGDRRLVLSASDGREITAVGVFKRGDENKVCTLWVDPSARGLDLGPALLRRGLEWIGNPQPLVTVPEERMAGFLPLFRRFGIGGFVPAPSLYRPGRTEFVANGTVSRVGGEARPVAITPTVAP